MIPLELMEIFTTRLGAVLPLGRFDLFSVDLIRANLDLTKAAQ
jgi:hypothetical protein